MSEIVGQLLLLALMAWIVHVMLAVRTRRHSPFKRYERPPTSWWRSLQWVPIGYATAKLLGVGAPLPIVLVTCALMAAVQRVFARPFEFTVGGGAALIAVIQAAEGSGCRLPMGALGLLLLATFGGAAILIVIVSGHPILRSSQYVSAGAAIVELTLFATSPSGGTLVAEYGPSAISLLVAVLLLSAAIGANPELGLSTLGAALIAGEVLLASSSGACDRSAQYALVGASTFVVARLFLSRRSRRVLVGVR